MLETPLQSMTAGLSLPANGRAGRSTRATTSTVYRLHRLARWVRHLVQARRRIIRGGQRRNAVRISAGHADRAPEPRSVTSSRNRPHLTGACRCIPLRAWPGMAPLKGPRRPATSYCAPCLLLLTSRPSYRTMCAGQNTETNSQETTPTAYESVGMTPAQRMSMALRPGHRGGGPGVLRCGQENVYGGGEDVHPCTAAGTDHDEPVRSRPS